MEIPVRNTLLVLLLLGTCFGQDIPREVPPRRSTQMSDGFGVNIALPREPRMPWTRTWTPLFNAGVKWVRVGQYENSSEKTSWDWVEQTPGHLAALPDVDEAIRSLADNGVGIEIQLQYSNPLYVGDPASRPKHVVLPPPGIGPGDKPQNPIFLPPRTNEQVEAFVRYARYMVGRYRGVVKHWELWNEENEVYWGPHIRTRKEAAEKGRWYGSVLARVADAIHQTDPQAKVIFGGLSRVDLEFTEAALAECASKVDIVAYHPYVGMGSNHAPEEADTLLNAAEFRERVLRVPGIRRDLEFWVNEWNCAPSYKDSNESVEARYVPRFYVWSHALRMRPFVWTFIPSTDGNEGDQYGLIHGETGGPDAFTPRPALKAMEITNALFGQTDVDPLAEFEIAAPERYSHGELRSYAFRDHASGKPIYAWWLAVVADPADRFQPVETSIVVHDSTLHQPVLIDTRTGAVKPLEWTDRARGELRVPLTDTVMALADASYLNWPELPEAPGALQAKFENGRVRLVWTNGGGAVRLQVERSVHQGPWQSAATLAPGTVEWSERLPAAGHVTYRVRADSKNGPSPWSNPAWVDGPQL